MLTRFVIKLSLVLFFSFFALGCAKEEVEYHEVIKIQLKGASCLGESVNKIALYFDGKASAQDVDEIWDCYTYALQTFDKYVKGQNTNFYTSKELRNFLETYFLKKNYKKNRSEHIISDALLDEMMMIKRLFLGGSTSSLEGDELEKTYELIKVFKKITMELLPHADVLFLSEVERVVTEPQFQAAEVALNKATADLVGLLNPRTSRYEVAQLTRLLNELHLFFLDMDPNSQFGKVHIYIPVIAKIKAMFLNTNSFAIEAAEWPALGKLLVQVGVVGLRYYSSISAESLYDPNQLLQIEKASVQSLQALDQAVRRRPGKSISIAEFGGIIDELDKIKLLPILLPSVEVKKLIELIFDFILNPQNQFIRSGLTSEKIKYLSDEFLGWSFVQNLILKKMEDLENSWWRQFKTVMDTPFSLSLDSFKRIVLDGENVESNLAAATRLNWARAGIGLLFKSYVTEAKRRKGNMLLSQKELHQAFLDLRPIFVGLGLVGNDDFSYDASLFRDANLFMPRSDGDDFLSFFEIIEYLHFVFAGIDAGKILVKDSDDSCQVSDDLLDVNCFRNNFKTRFSSYLSHLPFYLKYAQTLSDSRWDKDIRNMERTNRASGDFSKPIFKTDIYETFVMLQYIEVIMLRFDEDSSGDLDIKEALKAFKHFKNVIGGLLGLDLQTESDDIEAMFTYMLKYGETPDVNDPLARMRFQNWKWQKDKWRLTAHRGTFLQILATLKGL